MENKQNNEDSGYLFNVDILMKSRSNALALQALIEMLNSNEMIADFRIKSGMELGQLIESMLQDKRKSLINKSGSAAIKPPLPDNRPKPKAKTDLPAKSPDTPADSKVNTTQYSSQLHEWIMECIHDNRLIRLTVTRSGQPFSMPCRILNFEEADQLLNVYHVDEKQVYSFKLNEIIEVV